ncbi:Uncharacterised protein [BD1-7 clade bacterium]|uniref:Pyridoxamine 5'-phosphate oxidase N-terminal domain-containing protein n=1 Tax=BD1-7 clade bacterium TaxID=2029982 RepID=A0A5S9PST3_9GAMM|nr:Uncharacterised protein [BD1-7 clade bacterium]CAA0094699.1 Uncharacterised protein [BD1-7 clade bacterium]CAA0107878.1 Uncharacterised protein [BD1-7 clade bacterium]
MSAVIPESHMDLVNGPVYATFNTHMSDGSIQSTLVWFNYEDGYIWVNSKPGRVKYRNIQDNPNVSLLAVDTTNPWKYISIRGRVEDIVEEGAFEHIDALTQLYLGQPHYYGVIEPVEAKEGAVRCMYKIAIDKVMTMGE